VSRSIRDTRRGTVVRRALQRAVAMSATLVLILATIPLTMAVAEPKTLYLDGDGVPEASLSTASPSSGSLANLDPGRDDAPGLLLQKSNKGAAETDSTKYQMWIAPPEGLSLDGPASFTFWSAMKDFSNEKKGEVNAYLLDCTPSGDNCTVIESATEKDRPWSDLEEWVARTISFGSIDYSLAADRSLALKVTVNNGAQDDMWLAYDAVPYPSRLSVELAAPTGTTTTTTSSSTTTTTTTTTLAPAPTTTTTAAPPTTTTPATTTTTSVPTAPTTTTVPTTSTTTTVPTTAVGPGDPSPPTTTAPPPDDADQSVATTTTAPPPAGDSPPEPPEHDVAMAAIPEPDQTIAGAQRGDMSMRLTEGLEVVIPPLAATALLSPLILLEALLGAFVDTGRDLLIPGFLLFAASLWMTRGVRKRDLDLLGETRS
jgi:hypothetical protein